MIKNKATSSRRHLGVTLAGEHITVIGVIAILIILAGLMLVSFGRTRASKSA